MPKTMKAAVVREFCKPLVIEEVAVPEPGSGQIQVKIEASGVCHTDLHAANGDWPVKPNPPFIPGHEGVGFVSGVGSGVKHVKEGDRVGVPGSIPPVATASIVSAAGRLCARPSRIQDTQSMVDSRTTSSPIRPMSGISRQMSILSRLLRCCAPASQSTRVSRLPTPSLATGW
jgi:Zn-dependent alcohol dehydrogenase